MRKIIHILYIRTDQNYHVKERSDFFLISSVPPSKKIRSQLLRWTHIWTLRSPVVFVNTCYFCAQEAVSCQHVVTDHSPTREAKGAKQKSDLQRLWYYYCWKSLPFKSPALKEEDKDSKFLLLDRWHLQVYQPFQQPQWSQRGGREALIWK